MHPSVCLYPGSESEVRQAAPVQVGEVHTSQIEDQRVAKASDW